MRPILARCNVQYNLVCNGEGGFRQRHMSFRESVRCLGRALFLQGPRAHAAIVRPDHGSYGGGSPSASCGALVGLVSRAPDLVVPETFEKARRVAPGWDIYFLEGLWRDWIAGKEEPKNPDAAFIAFCRKKYQRKGMSG
jgi:hypothetical protein